MNDTLILALETSCDETAAAVIRNGREILSNVVHTQIPLHTLYGGVVPEIASRAHTTACDWVTEKALTDAGLTAREMTAMAVTCGPGLVGALLCGVNWMKAYAWACGKPLIPVNHIEGHVSANYLTSPDLEPPFTCLVVSGGHSHLVEVEDYGVYTLLGRTVDDAAGEAFDKAARVLGLPYPGGPRLDELAARGQFLPDLLPHPKTQGRYDYSFSGLKTAFLNHVNKLDQQGVKLPRADLACTFRQAVTEHLCEKAELLIRDRLETDRPVQRMALAGGVSANSLLRSRMGEVCGKYGIRLFMPALKLCTDNGAMIGSAAYWRYLRGETADLSLNAQPALKLI